MTYPASDPRSAWNPNDQAGARRADALAAQAADRQLWRNQYRTPSQVIGHGGSDSVRDLVDLTLILHSVEPATSQTKGRFTRWVYQTIDPETGELVGDPSIMVAFAQPVVRFADQLAGGVLQSMLILNPPVAVKVAAQGDVVLFVDP